MGTAIIKEVYLDISGQSFQKRKKLTYAAAAGILLCCTAALVAGWKYAPKTMGEWTQKLQATALSLSESASVPAKSSPDPIHPQTAGKSSSLPPPGAEKMPNKPSPLPDQQPQAADQTEQLRPVQDITHPSSLESPAHPKTAEKSSKDPQKAALEILLAETQRKRIGDQLSSFFSFFDLLSPTRQLVLIEMYKQTSMNGFLTFERMIDALYEQDFEEVSRQMVFSQWHDRVGKSATELARIMKTNDPQDLAKWIAQYASS